MAVERLLEPLVTQVIIRVASCVFALACVSSVFFPKIVSATGMMKRQPFLSWRFSENKRIKK